ncbi:MAG: M3 family metallopeptidase [Myxococcales bacterium]|nr:M3 family metallopeptidase [Myxococcales bacterium]
MSKARRPALLPTLLLGATVALAGCPKKASKSEGAGGSGAGTSAPNSEAYAAARAEAARLRPAADQHPLLAPWTGPYGGVPPWDKLDVKQVPSAFTASLALLEAEVAVIAEDPAPATFANTIAALEGAGRHHDRIDTLFSVMTSNLSNPEVQAVDKEWSPKISAAFDRINFNAKLFARISAVYAGRASLTPEQARLVTLRHDRMVRAGAQLAPADQAKLGAINEQLAGLFSEFSTRVLGDEDTWIVLDREADLAGLPPSQRAALKAAAAERKLPGGWAVVNTRSSVDPFLAASSRRDLRERVWKAFKSRGDNGDAHDTKDLIKDIVRLRAERATLLGFATHAHWRMADTMAVDPAKATALMMRVWPAAVARVAEEVADMTAIAHEEPGNAKLVIEPWDYLYYAEKVRAAKYSLDQGQITPYFELGNMVAAAFWMAERLYGLSFTEVTGQVPAFHADVRVWEVKDPAGTHVGLFYGDYFARAGKRSGAWASGYRGHETFTGATVTAITSNNNNFVRGAAGAPVLISLDDAETLFHEFGHALHGLLSEVNYPGLATTPRDFVEYPSQVHEQWVLSRPVLDKFAKHYQTGEPMPQALVDKIERAATFNQGYGTVEYLTSAILDMELHMLPDASAVDVGAFERDTLAKIGAPREVAMRHRLPQFNHLFTSDSYSAGYYSYLWSEVMDADTREAFAEAGDVFAPTVAGKLRQFILAPGNSTDRAEAYRQFRGRDPEVGALLKKRGFPVR